MQRCHDLQVLLKSQPVSEHGSGKARRATVGRSRVLSDPESCRQFKWRHDLNKLSTGDAQEDAGSTEQRL